MTRTPARASIALVALVLACGSSKRTMLVIEVQTNLGIPAEIDGVTLDVTAPGEAARHFSFPLGTGQYALPFRVGLLASDKQSSAEVTVVAAGQKGSAVVVSEQAVVAFLSGQARVLKFFLARECIDRTCAAPTDTCSFGGACIPARRQVDTLPPFDPNQPLVPISDGTTDGAASDGPAFDARASDAPAADAPAVDAPAVDASATEAPPIDAPAGKDSSTSIDASAADATCTCPPDDNPCMQASCDGIACVHKPIANMMTCPGGLCWNGACCTGCLDGFNCQPPLQASACGAGGSPCRLCDDNNPCTRDKCTAGLCDIDRLSGGTCPTGVCENGVCTCGGQGEPCCANQACQNNLACQGGTCGACGATNQDCCPGGTPCAGGLVCADNKRCAACGDLNQTCCTTGAPCRTGICDTNNRCQPCGAVGQPCCGGGSCIQDGNLCNGTETCLNGVCSMGARLMCDDGNPCTNEQCILSTGCLRMNAGPSTSCPDDGNRCTADLCDGNGHCSHPPAANGMSCPTPDGQTGVCNQGTCCVPTSCSAACGPRVCGTAPNGCGGSCMCGVGACPDAGF